MSIFILDGNQVDLEVALRGQVEPGAPAVVRTSANGVDVSAPAWVFTWRIPYLTRTEYEWFTQTVCGGELSVEATAETRLLTRDKEWLNFTACNVYAPRFEYFENNLFRNVTIVVDVTGVAYQPAEVLGTVIDLAAAAASDTQIDLTWSSVDNDGYRIERRLTGAGAWAEIDTAIADATSYSDTGLEGGVQYSYRIRAYRGAENGLYSNTADATTEPTVVDDWKTSGYTVLDSCGSSAGNVVERAFDGDTGLQWIHAVDETHFVDVDLGKVYRISQIRRYKISGGYYNWTNARLYISNDPDNWGSVALTFTTTATINAWSEHALASPVDGRYFRLEVDTTGIGDQIACGELQVRV